MRPLLLLFLMVAAVSADPFAKERAAWLQDVDQPAWWTRVTAAAGDPTPMVLPPGNPTPPKAVIDGCFHLAEVSLFQRYPLLNHRNVIRLLGKPTSSAARDQMWIITWNRPVVADVTAAADPTQSISVTVYGLQVIIGRNGKQFTWSLLPLDGAPLPPEKQLL
jgi:hypothetical protein